MHLADAVGPPNHVRPWLAALTEQAALEVVVPAEGTAAALYSELAHVTVLRYSPLTMPRGIRGVAGFLPRFAREARMFRAHVRRTRPDLVIAVTGTLPSALVGARLAGVPTLVYAAEIFRRNPARAVLDRLLVSLTRLFSVAIVASSKTVAAQYGHPRPGVFVVHPGVSSQAAVADREGFRLQHGLANASPCLAVVGNISFGRGQDVAIRAVSLLVCDFPDVACVVAGGTLRRPVDEDYLASLRRLASQLGVADRVRFTGFLENVDDLYAAADIVVNPARVPEGFGRVALEALVADRPVISTRVGAVPEVLRDGQDAVLVKPDSPEAIALAVARVWRDEDLRRRLVRSGQARALEAFSEAQGTERFREVVVDMLASRSGSRFGDKQ
jgi:glycosyltransferase involved in cell wall biosynthesis